ncbi:MAG: HlyD family efflux transporter periplasmic adaptor subunit [Pirellulales bacterium]|nr:HlyD family efflux transporter periplasmic adaptor subunit [Pirellulales bacterium]
MAQIRYIISEIVRWIVPLAILSVGIGVFVGVLLYGKPKPPENPPETNNAALVETAPVEAQVHGLDIDLDGLVVPYREITLAAEVAGRVVKKTLAAQAGSYVTKGTLLLEIDPRDYQFEVDRLQKQLKQADANLNEVLVNQENTKELIKLAEGSLKLQENEVARLKKLAKKDYVTQSQLEQEERAELTARNLLVGYQNQLRTLNAQQTGLESAKELTDVQLQKAIVDLERTKIISPIDGMVVMDSVETDAYINRGTALLTLEDTAKVEVRCNLRMDELFWILSQKSGSLNSTTTLNSIAASVGETPTLAPKKKTLSGNAAANPTPEPTASKPNESKHEVGDLLSTDQNSYLLPHTPATVEYSVAGRTYVWDGVLERYEGIGLDQDTRTVPCTVVVDNPRMFCQLVEGKRVDCHSSRGPSALVRGMFVKLLLHTRPQMPLVKVPAQAMRPGNRVWRVRDGKLSIVPIQVVNSMEDWAVIQPKVEGQLAEGDKVVISPLAVVEEGMPVREEDKK